MGRGQVLLKIGVRRGYLEAPVARYVLQESERLGRPVERVLQERGILSERRLERLRRHVHYRTLRNSDKRYGEIAYYEGLAPLPVIKKALELQRVRFERDRACLRVGRILIDQGVLSEAADRGIRATLRRNRQRGTERPLGTSTAASTLPLHTASQAPAGATLPVPSTRSHLDEESAATLALAESSRICAESRSASYRAIEMALERVQALRAMADDLSTSEQRPGAQLATVDSAAEFENACSVLARRRVPSAKPSKTARARNKGTAALRALLFRSNAA